MATISHRFPLPTFESLPPNDIKVFNWALRELRKHDNSSQGEKFILMGLANDLSEKTKEFYDPRQTFYEKTEGRYFRSPEWHVDNERDEPLRLFTSTTPTSYACFEIEVDTTRFISYPDIAEFYERQGTEFSRCRFEPAEVVRVLGYTMCHNWLEIAAGTERNDVTAEAVQACGIVVRDLVKVQAKPFEVAYGRCRDTVHASSPRKIGRRKSRILSRSFREIPTQAMAA